MLTFLQPRPRHYKNTVLPSWP